MAKQKKKPINPFFTGKTDIPDAFFCDRKTETELLVKKIENGSNIVLKAPRRIGKSSLIKHLFKQKKIVSGYNTLFVDIYGTKNMEEFIYEFQSAFFDSSFTRTMTGKKTILELLRSIYFQVNTDPNGSITGFSLGLNPPQRVSTTLRELFKFLEKTGKPNLIVFDEFQKINDYPENAAAILRTHIQQTTNTHFIFSGSSRHMLNHMFEYPNEPFYRSAASVDLGPIGMEPYTEFCQELFRLYGKDIETEAVHLVYQLFSANTYDMQEVMKETFAETGKDKTAAIRDVRDAIERLLDARDEEFREKLDRIDNEKNRRLLRCIAQEGLVTGLSSGAMMKKYNLDNASSVQNGLRVLMNDNHSLVSKVGSRHYQIQNRFLELWLARKSGTIGQKYQSVQERFAREQEIRKECVTL